MSPSNSSPFCRSASGLGLAALLITFAALRYFQPPALPKPAPARVSVVKVHDLTTDPGHENGRFRGPYYTDKVSPRTHRGPDFYGCPTETQRILPTDPPIVVMPDGRQIPWDQYIRMRSGSQSPTRP